MSLNTAKNFADSIPNSLKSWVIAILLIIVVGFGSVLFKSWHKDYKQNQIRGAKADSLMIDELKSFRQIVIQGNEKTDNKIDSTNQNLMYLNSQVKLTNQKLSTVSQYVIKLDDGNKNLQNDLKRIDSFYNEYSGYRRFNWFDMPYEPYIIDTSQWYWEMPIYNLDDITIY